MKLIQPVLNILFLSCVVCAGFAQTTHDFYQSPDLSPKGRGIGLRLGTNYSSPTVTAYTDSQNNTTILGGVTPRFGYYIGGFIYRDLVPNQVTFRLDATLQMKGVGAEYNGRPTVRASYYYVGLSPQIGVHLTNHLITYLGVEANSLVNTSHPWGKTYPFEIGGLIRLTYQVGRYGLEMGYFKGFTKYDSFEIGFLPGGGSSTNDFYNQTIHLGVFYKLSR